MSEIFVDGNLWMDEKKEASRIAGFLFFTAESYVLSNRSSHQSRGKSVEIHNARTESDNQQEGEKVAEAVAEHIQTGASLAAGVASAVHGGRKLKCPAEGGNKERNENGNQRLCEALFP